MHLQGNVNLKSNTNDNYYLKKYEIEPHIKNVQNYKFCKISNNIAKF